MMDAIGCSFVVASLIPTRKRTTSSLLQKERPCRRWLRPLAHAGTSKRMRENAKDLGLDRAPRRRFWNSCIMQGRLRAYTSRTMPHLTGKPEGDKSLALKRKPEEGV